MAFYDDPNLRELSDRLQKLEDKFRRHNHDGVETDEIDAITDLTSEVTGVLPIANGGTGQASQTAAFDALAPTTTQGDISYHNGTDNVRLAKGTTEQVLKINGAATAPEWGTVAVSAGGTGQVTKTAAFDNLAPTTTEGDLIYHNGADNVRLAKGTAAQILQMNSGATAPEWVTPAAKTLLGKATTDVTLTADTTETTLFSCNVPGGSLSTGNVITAILMFSELNTANGASEFTLKVKYGGTTLITRGLNCVTTASSGYFLIKLTGTGTNTQEAQLLTEFQVSRSTADVSSGVLHTVNDGTSSVTESSDQTFAVTGTFASANGTNTFTMRYADAILSRQI